MTLATKKISLKEVLFWKQMYMMRKPRRKLRIF